MKAAQAAYASPHLFRPFYCPSLSSSSTPYPLLALSFFSTSKTCLMNTLTCPAAAEGKLYSPDFGVDGCVSGLRWMLPGKMSSA